MAQHNTTWWHLPWPMVWHLCLSTSCLPDYNCTFHIFAHFSTISLSLSCIKANSFMVASLPYSLIRLLLASNHPLHTFIQANLNILLQFFSCHHSYKFTISQTSTIKLTHNFNLINFIRNLKLSPMLSQQMTIVRNLT